MWIPVSEKINASIFRETLYYDHEIFYRLGSKLESFWQISMLEFQISDQVEYKKTNSFYFLLELRVMF